ncbi:MAG: hypothetical protein MHM6MM_008539 [Cercozoa sp. M6MM]
MGLMSKMSKLAASAVLAGKWSAITLIAVPPTLLALGAFVRSVGVTERFLLWIGSHVGRKSLSLWNTLNAHALQSSWGSALWLWLYPTRKFTCGVCTTSDLPVYQGVSWHVPSVSHRTHHNAHLVCLSCTRQWLRSTRDRVNLPCPLCVQAEETYGLSDSWLRHVYRGLPEQYERMCQLRLRQALFDLPTAQEALWHCPGPECENALLLPPAESVTPACSRLDCRGCNSVCICMLCRQPWSVRAVARGNGRIIGTRELHHDNTSCDTFARSVQTLQEHVEQWNERNTIQWQIQISDGQHALTVLNPQSAQAKPCPRCGALISLTSGCQHMTCHCRYEFCYACLQPWRGHTSAACNLRWQLDRSQQLQPEAPALDVDLNLAAWEPSSSSTDVYAKISALGLGVRRYFSGVLADGVSTVEWLTAQCLFVCLYPIARYKGVQTYTLRGFTHFLARLPTGFAIVALTRLHERWLG